MQLLVINLTKHAEHYKMLIKKKDSMFIDWKAQHRNKSISVKIPMGYFR